MKKLYAFLMIIFVAGGGLGTYAYIYAQDAQNLQIEFNKAEISNISPGGTLFDPRISFDLDLYGIVSSPSGRKITIDGADFTAYLEDIYLGTGHVDKFTADQDGENITIHFHAANLGLEVVKPVNELLNGQNKTVNIYITKVKVFGISISTNFKIEYEISRDDIIG